MAKLENDNISMFNDECVDFLFNETKEKIKSVKLSIDILDKKSFVLMVVLMFVIGLVSLLPKYLDETSRVVLTCGFLVSLMVLFFAVTKQTYRSGFKFEDILKQDDDCLQNIGHIKCAFIIFYIDDIDHNYEIYSTKGSLINISLGISLLSLIIFIMQAGS